MWGGGLKVVLLFSDLKVTGHSKKYKIFFGLYYVPLNARVSGYLDLKFINLYLCADFCMIYCKQGQIDIFEIYITGDSGV